MTPSGIEPATCRFVAKCLNHYAIAHFREYIDLVKNMIHVVFFLLGNFRESEFHMSAFGTHCFVFIGGANTKNKCDDIVGVFTEKSFGSKTA